jgi:hypothetical protein
VDVNQRAARLDGIGSVDDAEAAAASNVDVECL